jgi:hypothetical protein
MVALVERMASAVQSHFPFAHCFPCLATHLCATEPEVRSAAQVLLMRDAFKKTQRTCYSCGRVDDALVPRKGEPPAGPHAAG